MKNFGEYHNLYLETDVLLLVDVFMNYTIICLKDDGLDPSYYVSTPGMFNDSLYKSSGAELKLMTNIDEYLMVENSIQRGMTMASYRYAKVNNPKCSDYDPSKPKFWVLYEDFNALYSGAMTQYMPTEILEKVGPEKVLDIRSIAPDAEIGYTLEVDLEVLVHLHDFFADYPLVPEKQIVPEDWLSLYNERLVYDKEVGVENTCLERSWFRPFLLRRIIALKFRQSPWMKEYIKENIRKCKIAKVNEDEFG
ncbi:13292_t:CDS:2, partial [Racocetra persica]